MQQLEHDQLQNNLWRLTSYRPSHSNSLPLVMNSKESVSSGVSMSSTLISRSSGVSRMSSDRRDPSLRSKDRFMSGAMSVLRLLWAAEPPWPLCREPGGAETWREGTHTWTQLIHSETVTPTIKYIYIFAYLLTAIPAQSILHSFTLVFILSFLVYIHTYLNTSLLAYLYTYILEYCIDLGDIGDY